MEDPVMEVCFCVVSGVCGLGMFRVCLLLWSCEMGIALRALLGVSGLVIGVGVVRY